MNSIDHIQQMISEFTDCNVKSDDMAQHDEGRSLWLYVKRYDPGTAAIEIRMDYNRWLMVTLYQRGDSVLKDHFDRLDSFTYQEGAYYARPTFDNIIIIAVLFNKAIERYYL